MLKLSAVAIEAIAYIEANVIITHPIRSNYNLSGTWVAFGIVCLLNLILILLSFFLKQQSRETGQAEVLHPSKELELRVEERTVQLSKANEKLQRQLAECREAEKTLRFLQTMTQAINEASDFHSALRVALQNICDFTGWKFGEAWIPSLDGKTLEYSPAWYGTSQNLEKFRQASEQFTFSLGTGLSGRVWSSKHPEWIHDVSSEPETVFLRKHLALEAGFKTGLSIPIIDNNNQVLAVLGFFMFEACEKDEQLVEIISPIATQLGSLIQHKQAEEALRQSEERFRLLIEGVRDYAIFMLDTNGHVVTWNCGAERLKGYRADEIIGAHYSCFYLEEDIALGKPDQQLHLCLVDGHIEEEGWRLRKDGSRIWANVVTTALRTQDGKLCGFSKVTRDITQRKQTEEALRESEKRLQRILDNSTALIYVKDLQGKYLLINSWYGILFNLNREEIKGKTDYDIFPKGIADVFRENDKKVLEAKTALDWEEVFPHDDGFHTYLSIKFPLYDCAGVPYAVCGISTDITARKQAEEALRSSIATNRALLNAIPDWMFRISSNGTFVNFKATKDNNLPLPQTEFLGKNLYEVLPPEVAQSTMNCVERALSTGEMQVFEYQLLVNDDLLEYEARIAVSAENEVMAIVRNITERKRVEADIRTALEKEKELNELKSRFITMASHEFRTPLATILSSTELLQHYSHKWSEEKKLQHFQRIQAAVKHMTGLLNDVLLIGKAEAGKLQFNPTVINLSQFCRELVEEMQLTASDYRIVFRNQVDSLTDCMMDEKLLRHILSNLLSNAIKYSPQGSTVSFELVCEQGNAVFRIQDQGIGIPVPDQAQLFNSFHMASNVGTISGTGLGLAIIKKSVDFHGGNITFESEVGEGTAFIVTLPLLRLIENKESNV
jgi:PAS domain S-box-containing protein